MKQYIRPIDDPEIGDTRREELTVRRLDRQYIHIENLLSEVVVLPGTLSDEHSLAIAYAMIKSYRNGVEHGKMLQKKEFRELLGIKE